MTLRNRIEQLELHMGITNEGIAGDEKLPSSAWESLCVGYGPEILPEQNRARAAEEEPPAMSEVLATVERVYGEPLFGGDVSG